MKKTLFYMTVPALVLLGTMIYLLCVGEQDAEMVRDRVVRFHVVAESDNTRDQQLKLQVRDGVFALVQQLFAGCENRQEALEIAQENRTLLEERAAEILKNNGSDLPVSVQIGERYFPTKAYGSLSFPAGRYQAVSIQLGKAQGQNFWCVLYPALCIAPAVAEDTAREELAAVIGERSTEFLKKSSEKQKIKFALVEWFEQIRQKILKN